MISNKIDALKAFLTRLVDNARLSYRQNPEHAPRRCVFAGTVNDDGAGVLPEDGTGSRRWNIVRVEGQGDHPETVGADRDQYWAEAPHRVAQGESPVFPDAMAQQQAATNERYRMRNPFEDEVAEIEPKARQYMAQYEIWRTKGFAPSMLWEWAGLMGKEERDDDGKVTSREGQLKTSAQVSKADAMQFSRALKTRGWTRLHTEHGARWFPPKAVVEPSSA